MAAYPQGAKVDPLLDERPLPRHVFTGLLNLLSVRDYSSHFLWEREKVVSWLLQAPLTTLR